MAVNVNNSYVGNLPMDGGVFFRAPLGTPLPKTASEKLNEAFADHGAVAEDGFTVTPERSTTTIKMFGGGDFRDVQTEYTQTVSITLLEDDNIDVIKTTLGEKNVLENTNEAGGVTKTIYHTEQPLPISSFVLKSVDGEKTKTYVLQKARVSTVEKTADVHSDVTRTTLTLKVFKTDIPEYEGAYVVELREDNTLVGANDPEEPGA